jgi:hypothetical protein
MPPPLVPYPALVPAPLPEVSLLDMPLDPLFPLLP